MFNIKNVMLICSLSQDNLDNYKKQILSNLKNIYIKNTVKYKVVHCHSTDQVTLLARLTDSTLVYGYNLLSPTPR